MSNATGQLLRCVNCGRAIEVCACCDERNCPPPTCGRCLTNAILKTIRSRYVYPGASLIDEGADAPSVPARNTRR
jgi:hypothetical protein